MGARARRNTWLAVAFDLKVFFTAVGKQPAEVTPGDVLGFIESQRAPRRGPKVVRLEDRETGLSARKESLLGHLRSSRHSPSTSQHRRPPRSIASTMARSFIAEGKGGHQRFIPISGRFFATVGDYLKSALTVFIPSRRPAQPSVSLA